VITRAEDAIAAAVLKITCRVAIAWQRLTKRPRHRLEQQPPRYRRGVA